MIRAAGMLLLAPGPNALFLKRGPGGDRPGEWCFPGGKIEGEETALEAAERETAEEIGFLPEGDRKYLTRRIGPRLDELGPPDEVDFTTFAQKVDETFVPKLDGEHVAFAWAPLDQPPEPLHPGCRIALSRLGMNELGVARAIAAGELTSPQRYDNVTLFAMRVTGTGAAYRHKWKEYVWRDPSLYLNDEFCARCAGLPVIWEHPKKSMLDSKEYADRNVGSIMFAYVQGDEVWGIAKIYDDEAAKLMSEERLSTSPAVVFRNPDVNKKLEAEDGNSILIEGEPSLLDHLAVCEQGVWDKGGEPTGISSETEGVGSIMADEDKKAADDAARKDADEKMDKILSALDGAMGAIDGIGKRMDSVEAMVRDRKDAKKRDDDDAKKDAKRDDDDARRDRKDAKKADAEEGDEEERDEPEPVAADKKRRADAKKRDDAEEGEEEEKEEREDRKDAKKRRADARKRDDDDDARRDRKDAKKDDDDDCEADDDDDARKDSVDIKDVLREVRRIAASTPKPLTDADYDAMADEQARADAIFAAHGERAPRPLLGETPLVYARRMAKALQGHSARWKDANLTAIADATTFETVKSQIYADALEAARRPTNIPEGRERAIARTDSATGHRITEFQRSSSFVRQFKPRTRRVTALNTRFDR